MNTQVSSALLGDSKKPGLLETLPPWGLVVAGVLLLLLAGLLFWFNKKKLDDESFILEMAAVMSGIIGVIAFWTGLFGG